MLDMLTMSPPNKAGKDHEFGQPPVCPLVHDVVVPELQPLTPGALAASPHWAHARLPLKWQHTIEQHLQLPPCNCKRTHPSAIMKSSKFLN